MSGIISVQNLSKHFKVYDKKPGLIPSIKSIFYRPERTIKAVNRVSFDIKKGELLGFIGPNGAGKTTTLKCLSGLLHPDRGQISVAGFNPWERKKEFLKNIGLVLGQKNQLWWDIPPQETFLLNKAIYEIPTHLYKKRLDFFVSTLKIKKEISIQTRKLSLGQRMKCEFVAALIHQPDIIFLDEPTIGLDVVMQEKIRDFIKQYNEEFKATIILTSHYMKDVQELCSRVLIIDRGKLHFDGLLRNLQTVSTPQKLLILAFKDDIPREKLKGFGQIIKYENSRVTLSVNKTKINETAARALKTLPVTDLNIEDIPLEETIREIFRH
jgi:ABC-2 type transport system ATP-binding protein